jgi:hypothetical protein
VLSLLLRTMRVQFLVDRAFGWYLQQAHPALAVSDGRRPAHDAPTREPATPRR